MCGHACLDRLLGAILASDRRISFVSTFLGTDRADDATQPVSFRLLMCACLTLFVLPGRTELELVISNWTETESCMSLWSMNRLWSVRVRPWSTAAYHLSSLCTHCQDNDGNSRIQGISNGLCIWDETRIRWRTPLHLLLLRTERIGNKIRWIRWPHADLPPVFSLCPWLSLNHIWSLQDLLNFQDSFLTNQNYGGKVHFQ